MDDGTNEAEPQELVDMSLKKTPSRRKSMRKSVAADNDMGTPLQKMFKTPKSSLPVAMTESNESHEVVVANEDIIEGDEVNEANQQNEE